MSSDATYQNPLTARYASPEMGAAFSDQTKFSTWRSLWIALAEAERDLGLPVTDEQVEELRRHRDHINYDVARKREREVRHDVMAHVYAYGEQCPTARPIIHLGATSAFVQDDLPPSMCPHPELGYGCGERFGDRFRCRWAIAQ